MKTYDLESKRSVLLLVSLVLAAVSANACNGATIPSVLISDSKPIRVLPPTHFSSDGLPIRLPNNDRVLPERWPDAFAEAQYLALEISGKLVAPARLTEQLETDLAAIRHTFPEVADITVLPEWRPGELLVGLTPEAFEAYSAGDLPELNRLFEGLDAAVVGSTPTWGYVRLNLQFDEQYHPEVLGDAMSEIDGIVFADPDYLVGDGNDILITNGRYRFVRGSGDCPSGCIDKEYSDFIVQDGVARRVPEPTGASLLIMTGLVLVLRQVNLRRRRNESSRSYDLDFRG